MLNKSLKQLQKRSSFPKCYTTKKMKVQIPVGFKMQ